LDKEDNLKKKEPVQEVRDQLTEDQSARLNVLENAVSTAAGSVYERSVAAGFALAEISDQRLYRAEHKTFEKYVVSKLQMSRGYAYELMGVSKIVGVLSDASDIPTKPSSITQVKRLLKLKDDPERLVKAWKLALSWTITGNNVKASDIGNAVRHVLHFERQKRTSRRIEPTLFRSPERMGKYIVSSKGREYANALMLMLMAELAPAGVTPTVQSEAVA
jgi:transcription antitermination factor NusG